MSCVVVSDRLQFSIPDGGLLRGKASIVWAEGRILYNSRHLANSGSLLPVQEGLGKPCSLTECDKCLNLDENTV